MERRKFGDTDMHVSVLGFGAAEIGFQATPADTVRSLLHAGLDAGLNMIDTAACYRVSEELIGQAVAERRKDYYLFTKCGHASGLPYEDWDPRLVEASIDRSLKRLKTDCVDVVHLHSCSREVLERGEVIEALERVKEKGKTRYIGYSGDREAALYAVRSGRFDSLEISLNIADQQAIETTLPEAAKRNMGVIAKRPIANAAWKQASVKEDAYEYSYFRRLQELGYDFLKEELAQAVGQALRFTLTVPGVHTAIVGTSKPDRWQQNAALLASGKLPAEAYEAIRARWAAVAKPDWVGQT